MYGFIKMVCTFILIIFGSRKVEGRKFIPTQGSLIVVCNHRSYWDPVLVGCAMKRQVHFMAKAEIFAYPILKNILNMVHAFPIKRGQSDRTALRTAINLLKEDRVIGIFPEGTRSKTEELLPFKPGVSMMAYKAGCPVLPMAVINSKKVLLGWWYPVKVVIGEPIYFPPHDQRPSGEALEKMSEKISQSVADLLDKSS